MRKYLAEDEEMRDEARRFGLPDTDLSAQCQVSVTQRGVTRVRRGTRRLPWTRRPYPPTILRKMVQCRLQA